MKMEPSRDFFASYLKRVHDVLEECRVPEKAVLYVTDCHIQKHIKVCPSLTAVPYMFIRLSLLLGGLKVCALQKMILCVALDGL